MAEMEEKIWKRQKPNAPEQPTIQPGQLTDSPRSRRTPKDQKPWSYACTPVPKSPTRRHCSSTSSLLSEKPISYRDGIVPVYCFVYYEDKGKLRRKLIRAELKIDMRVDEAVRRMISEEKIRNIGRTYLSSSRDYKDFQEVHVTRDGAKPLSDFDSYFFSFDVSGHIAKKAPVTLEFFPLWHI